MRKPKKKILLSPNAPGLDEETRRRRRVLAGMQRMSPRQLVELAVQAGILTKGRKLAKEYRNDAGP